MQATGVLHQALWTAIHEIAWQSNTYLQQAITFLEFLHRKRHMENTTPTEYTDLAAVYLRQKIHTQYRQVVKPLLQAGVLQSSNYYRPGYYTIDDEYIKGQCLSYRINPDLLDDDIIQINYKGEKIHQKCRDQVTMTSKRLMRQIRIPDMNSRELIAFVKASLTDQRIRRHLKVNDEITDTLIHIKGQPYPIPLHKVQRRSKDLIKDGKHCHIEHLDVYIKRKRRHLMQAYCDQLLRLKHRNIYADRNDTNLRLDSNLTNLKSDYLSLLAIDGQRLSQVDLKNSQFRFFVYLMEQCERDIRSGRLNIAAEKAKLNTASDRKTEIRKEGRKIEGKPVTLLLLNIEEYATHKQGLMVSFSKDYGLFKKLVKNGQLYEHIQELIWRDTGRSITRSEAKKIMFTIAFSSYRYEPEEKQVLKRYFPSIISIIDGYKRSMIHALANGECRMENVASKTSSEVRDKGNARFAILLQQVESLIFIDEILAKCHKKGLKALSKHDSIVCRQCDKHKVTKIVCKVLNSLFGRYTYALDIDGELFDLKPKRKSRIAKVATTLFSHLMGGGSMDNGPPVDPKDRSSTCLSARQELQVASYEVGVIDNANRNLYTGSVALYPTTPKTVSDPVGSTNVTNDRIKSERVRRLRDKLGL